MEYKTSIKIEKSMKYGMLNGESISMSAEGPEGLMIVLAEDFLEYLKSDCQDETDTDDTDQEEEKCIEEERACIATQKEAVATEEMNGRLNN